MMNVTILLNGCNYRVENIAWSSSRETEANKGPATYLGNLVGRRSKTPRTFWKTKPLILGIMRPDLPFECSLCIWASCSAHELRMPQSLLKWHLSAPLAPQTPCILCLAAFGIAVLYFSTLTPCCLVLAQDNSHSNFYWSHCEELMFHWHYRDCGLCSGPKERPEDRKIIKLLTSTSISKGTSPRN